MTNRIVKQKLVLAHLRKRPITSLEAIALYGDTRLSSSIYELRKKGHNIITKTITTRDRWGNKCRVAQYRLIKETKK